MTDSETIKHWFVAVVVTRYESGSVAEAEWLVHEEFKLIRADSLETAYNKAEVLGKLGDDIPMVDDAGVAGRWKYVGLSELIPVYEDFEDGSELIDTLRRLTGRCVLAAQFRNLKISKAKDAGATYWTLPPT